MFTLTIQQNGCELPTVIPVSISSDQMTITINGFPFDYHYSEWTCIKCQLFHFNCAYFPCSGLGRFDKQPGFYALRDNHEEVAD